MALPNIALPDIAIDQAINTGSRLHNSTSVTVVVRRRNCEKKRLPKNRSVRENESQRDSGEGEGSTTHACDLLRPNPEAYDPQPNSPDHRREA